MRILLLCLPFVVLLSACGQTSVRGDVETVEVARTPEQLETLRARYSAEVAYMLGEGPAVGDLDELPRIRAELDRASGQHDGWASGLFWYTLREAALAAARREGLPVLNLWLLGRLDDEFC